MKKLKIDLKKLNLNKERILSLSNEEMGRVNGGEQISRGGGNDCSATNHPAPGGPVLQPPGYTQLYSCMCWM